VRPVEFHEFARLQESLIPILPDHLPPRPGTELGTLRGRARGTVGDFSWPQTWTICVSGAAVTKLQGVGVQLTAVPVDLSMSPGFETPLLEIEIWPLVRISNTSLKEPGVAPCQVCGRIRDGYKEPLTVERDSVPLDVDLFRAMHWPSQILCTERFRDSVKELRLTGAEFAPVESV
jgi:uncharacterized double-CXXCG motif protein